MLKKSRIFILGIAISIMPVNLSYAKDLANESFNIHNGVVTLNYNNINNDIIKVVIQKGQEKYVYDLNGNKTFPLTMGNGEYVMNIAKKVSNSYVLIDSKKLDVKIKNEKDIYLDSIQNINWSLNDDAIKKAKEITQNLVSNDEKVQAIYKYIISNIKYDYYKMNNVKSDYIPNINDTFKTGTGICYDYASLSAGMLRSLGIPTKLVKGYKNDIQDYHAWNEVYLNNKWVIIDTTYDATLKSRNLKYEMIKKANEYKPLKIY